MPQKPFPLLSTFIGVTGTEPQPRPAGWFLPAEKTLTRFCDYASQAPLCSGIQGLHTHTQFFCIPRDRDPSQRPGEWPCPSPASPGGSPTERNPGRRTARQWEERVSIESFSGRFQSSRNREVGTQTGAAPPRSSAPPQHAERGGADPVREFLTKEFQPIAPG